MIEIAPGHKRGLSLAGPMMNAAGFMGFADEYRSLVDFDVMGAFVTNPISARSRTPARAARLRDLGQGGALIHTGLPNPGIRKAIQLYGRKWGAMRCPVLVHVAATTPAEVAECLELLETVEGAAGVELGLKDGLNPSEVAELVAAAVQSGSLPIIVRVPFQDPVLAAEAARSAGAVALTVSAPPRGALLAGSDERVTGRLVGPAFFPLALNSVLSVIGRVDLPVIGSGGVHDAGSARIMLTAGAVAVQVDGQIWRDPASLERIAEAIAEALSLTTPAAAHGQT